MGMREGGGKATKLNADHTTSKRMWTLNSISPQLPSCYLCLTYFPPANH